MTMPAVRVFVSHLPDDLSWVKVFADGLEREGIDIFLTARDIAPGQIRVHRIDQAIGSADAAVIVFHSADVTDPEFGDQYAALLGQASWRDLPVIPVLYGAATAAAPLPPLAGTRLWADFRGLDPAAHDAKLALLARVLRTPGEFTGPPVSGRAATEVLDALRTAPPQALTPPATPAFVVTYARADVDYGERLTGWLRAAGLPAWSIADLLPGTPHIHEVRRQLRFAVAVVVVMSPAAEDSPDVEREILEGTRHGRIFFPVLLTGDRNFLLASTWSFDARGGRLPGEPELRRLRRIAEAARTGRVVPPPAPLALPAGAPSVPGPPGTPLRRLRALLAEGEVEHADIWTTALLLAAADRLNAGWLDGAERATLPLSLLTGIDAAWSAYTGGQHGFRCQLDRYRLISDRGTDFIDLADAYHWRRPPAAIPTYAEFVTDGRTSPGFFPTLRNPQIEAHPRWYTRWQSTAVAVHLRLRDWASQQDHESGSQQ